MQKMIKFTDIGQFRSTVHNVCHIAEGEVRATQPTLRFLGSCKLHGTNAGISFSKEDGIWYQSRKNIITPIKDNAGFAFFAESNKDFWIKIFDYLYKDGYITTVFGEWCGGSIQKGVALNQLDKCFVVFAIKYTGVEDEVDHFYIKPDFMNEDIAVYNIYDFVNFSIDIDFNQPQLAQATMVDLVLAVEKECPFAKEFGISGVGEGIVWAHYDENGHRDHIFKTKGEKHSSSKVKVLAAVDVEKVNSINEFVEYTVTENRLNQAIEQVFTVNAETPSIKKMGDFLRWISRDVIKEEMDTAVANNLEPKDFGKALSTKARLWFMTYLDSQENII